MKKFSDIYKGHIGKLSDKWTSYLDIYDDIFVDYEGKEVNVLEVGIQNGGSLEIYAAYFKNAINLVGCDINQNCHKLNFTDKRIKINVGDINDIDIINIINKNNYDIIIDDGSHSSRDIILTFANYFQNLNLGGVYIIEDLHASYWASCGGGIKHPFSSINFLKDLCDIINYENWGIEVKRKDLILKFQEYYSFEISELELSMIHSVQFYNSICVIRKKNPNNNKLGYRQFFGEEALIYDKAYLENSLVPTNESGNKFSFFEGRIPDYFQDESVIVAQSLGKKIQHQSSLISAATEKLNQVTKSLAEVSKLSDDRALAIEEIYCSTSWRITKPLRFLKKQILFLKRLTPHTISILRVYGGINLSFKKLYRCYKNEGLIGVKIRLNKLINGDLPSYTFLNKSDNIKLITKKAFRSSLWRQTKGNKSNFLDKNIDPNFLELPSIVDKNFLEATPFFSILTPIFNTDILALQEMIDSVLHQSFPYWELVLVDDCSTNPLIIDKLNDYARREKRIKIFQNKINQGISITSNKALNEARGEYVVLVDHDDLVHKDALLENFRVISACPDVDVIYSDEDKIDASGKFYEPYHKPDWSEINLFTTMYLGHLLVYRRDLVLEVGGFRSEYDGTQDYDLALRATEKARRIIHIPKILYHWRVGPSSAAGNASAKDYVFERQKAAIQGALLNRGISSEVISTKYLGNWRIKMEIPNPNPKVSIVIPSACREGVIRGKKVDILGHCLKSLLKTSYTNIEIIISSNELSTPSVSPSIRNFCDLKEIKYSEDTFNLAQKINQAVSNATGEFVVLLNDDVEVISPDWIENMLQCFALKSTGCVGAKLLFENGTIQHAGVVFQEEGPTHIMIGRDGNDPGPNLVTHLTREVVAVTGACLMVKKDVFDAVGGVDVDFPLNYNDVDFCLKIRNLGLSIIFEPSAVLFHFESLSKEGTYSRELEKFKKRWGEVDDPFYNINFDRSNPFFTISNKSIFQNEDSSYEGWLEKNVIERAQNYLQNIHDIYLNGPSFSIITSVYNTEKNFLLELAENIYFQKYKNFEWVIVDNGSTSSITSETLEYISRKFDYVKLVKVIHNEGIIGGMRIGLHNATKQYILPMDSDDLITTDALLLMAKFIINNNYPELVYSDEDKCDVNSRRYAPFFKTDWDPVLFYGCCYIAHLCAISREMALELGCYSDPLATGCHDWDTFLRFIRKGITPFHLDEVIYSWRAHPSSTASADPSVKTFTVQSQEHVLTQHLSLMGFSTNIAIQKNELFDHDGMWRIARKNNNLPKIIIILINNGVETNLLNRSFSDYETYEINSFLEFKNLITDNNFDREACIAIIDKSLTLTDDNWGSEVLGLLEVFKDASVISGTIKTMDNHLVWAGGFFNYKNGEISPCIDCSNSNSSSGYFGNYYLQRSVDTFSPMLWMCKVKNLEEYVANFIDCECISSFAGFVASKAKQDGKRVIISPFIVGRLYSDEVIHNIHPTVKGPSKFKSKYYNHNQDLVS